MLSQSWGSCDSIYRHLIYYSLFSKHDFVQLHFDDSEKSSLLPLFLIIAGLCHFICCVGFASQWRFVNKHPLVGYKRWLDVYFGIVVPFVLRLVSSTENCPWPVARLSYGVGPASATVDQCRHNCRRLVRSVGKRFLVRTGAAIIQDRTGSYLCTCAPVRCKHTFTRALICLNSSGS